jgi:uncharacterized protein DUF222
MFESAESALVDTFSGVDDAGVVEAIGAAAVEENAACARRLAAMGELYARRAPADDTERACWAIDGHENVVAEISAELHISRGRARGQLRYAIHLREKLPRVMGVFERGVIDMRMVTAIVNRAALIIDADMLARLDAALARWAPRWMRLSGPKLEERIDWWVERVDPNGRRVPGGQPEQRYVEWFPVVAGMVGMYAQLRSTDAAAIDQRLQALADSVCPNDGRTRDQRLADALGALAAGLDGLRCECQSPECTAAHRPTGTKVVIHVLAEQSTVDGAGSTPGHVPGHGVLPAKVVQDLAQTAKLKPLVIPDPAAPAESGYRPSAALAEFIRCRDLTCRFPGCDQPAAVCDIDHTIPWPVGPTHPSNLKLYCRGHHLLKTFWTGTGGWAEKQFPDGTVHWRSPSGRIYTTKPGGALFFPILNTPTGQAPIGKLSTETGPSRGVMMPRRKHPRAQELSDRIAAERRANEARIADEQRRHQAWLAATYEPPPF